MSKLTKYEKETIILFSEGEDIAHIQTYNAGLRNRLAAFSKKYPGLCRLEKTYAQGGVSYVLDKAQFFIKPEKGQLTSDHKDMDPAKVLSKIEVKFKGRKLTQEYTE